MNNTFNVPKDVTEAGRLLFYKRLNYHSSTEARQEPRTHILCIKTYPLDNLTIRQFLKTTKVEFFYNEQNTEYINFLEMRLLQTIVIYRWCPKAS